MNKIGKPLVKFSPNILIPRINSHCIPCSTIFHHTYHEIPLDGCFIFPDNREFCTNEDYSLKFFINHKPVSGIQDNVIQDQDRILISYGNENQKQLNSQLAELDSQPILGFGMVQKIFF